MWISKKVNWKKILGDFGDVPVPCRIILSFMPGETLSSRASLAVPCECHSLENWGGNSILLLQMLPHCPGNSVVVAGDLLSGSEGRRFVEFLWKLKENAQKTYIQLESQR